MPVTIQTPVTTYIANGSVTSFSFPFRVINQNDLFVYKDGEQVLSGFTVTGINNPTGGDVVFSSAPPNGATIRLQRVTALERTADYVEGGQLAADTLDSDLDRIVMMIQDISQGQLLETGDGKLDAQGRIIKNVGDPVNDGDAVNKRYVDTITGVNGYYLSTGVQNIHKVHEIFTATEDQTLFTFADIEYELDGNQLEVHVNGVYQTTSIDYTESSSTSIEFTTPLNIGDRVTVSHITTDVSFINLEPAGGGSPTTESGIKIAVISDSLLAQNAILTESPLHILERVLNQMGGNVRVIGCGRDGHTFYRANTTQYIGGKTSVEFCIEEDPDVVIVALGINDAANSTEGRSLVQMQNDAFTLFSHLRTSLPTAKICYASEVPYDRANFTPDTLLNRGALPFHFALRTSGILQGLYSDEILGDSVSALTKTRIGNWKQLNDYIIASAPIDHSFDLNVWRIARLGGLANDGLHFNHGGYILAAGYLAKGLRAMGLTVFQKLFTNNFDYWDDPDTLFNTAFTATGTGYNYTNADIVESQNIISGNSLRPTTWHLPENATLSVTDGVVDSGDNDYVWMIKGAKKNTRVRVSVNGAAFVNLTRYTNDSGDAFAIASGAGLIGTLVNGNNVLRYAVGNVCLPPQNILFSPQNLGWQSPMLLNGWENYNNGTAPVGFYLDKFKRVHLRGMIKGGTSGSQAFSLPVACRPSYFRIIGTIGGGTTASVQVTTTGQVFLTGNTTGITLDGVSFEAA